MWRYIPGGAVWLGQAIVAWVAAKVLDTTVLDPHTRDLAVTVAVLLSIIVGGVLFALVLRPQRPRQEVTAGAVGADPHADGLAGSLARQDAVLREYTGHGMRDVMSKQPLGGGIPELLSDVRLVTRFKGEEREDYRTDTDPERSIRFEVENRGSSTGHDARLSLRIDGFPDSFDGWRWSSNLASVNLPPGARETFTFLEAAQLGSEPKWYLTPFDFVRYGSAVEPSAASRLTVHVSIGWSDKASQQRSSLTECFSLRVPDAKLLDQPIEALKVVCDH